MRTYLNISPEDLFQNSALQKFMTIKQNFLLLIFFACLSVSIFAPIASNQYLPNSFDMANHVVGIGQAKAAIEQNQFPIRTAPAIYQGWHYPYFQFYSPMAYTLGGMIYKFLTPSNPFIAYKLTLWFALIFAGYFMFRFVDEMVRSKPAAILAAVLYLLSPYLMLEIGVRGFFTESLAICLLPWLLFCTIKLQREGSLLFFISSACAWFFVLTFHLITFFCASIFIGLFVVFINIQESLPINRLIFFLLAYVLGLILAIWYLAPIIMLQPYLYVHHTLSNPFNTNWLTPLATLLSPRPVSPMPLPGNGLMSSPFYVGIGWPVLASVGIVIFKKNSPLIYPLLFLFLLGFFLVWSPVDFWSFLPEFVKVIQFSSRFLSEVMWVGALLFAYVLIALFEKLDIKHIVIGTLFIGAMNGAWLMTNQGSHIKLADLIHQPQFYVWGSSAYSMSPMLFHYTGPGSFVPVHKVTQDCKQENNQTVCSFNFSKKQLVQLPFLYFPNMVEVKVDDQMFSYQPIAERHYSQNIPITLDNVKNFNSLLVGIELQSGPHKVSLKFTGMTWANYLSMAGWLVILVLGGYTFTLRHREAAKRLAAAIQI